MDKTQATRTRILLKKYKKFIGSYKETANFDEPIMILMRRSHKAEFYEKATQGEFEFEHSDGTKRIILINPKYQQTFDYGKKYFRGYICHEDYPVPLPAEPLLTAEQVSLTIQKTLNDMAEWKAKEQKAIGMKWWHIFLGIAVCIAAFTFWQMMAGDNNTTPAQTILTNAVGIIKPTGGTIINATPPIP